MHKSAIAHQRATEWARSVAVDRNTVFLDLETLGKEHDSEICDIGIVRVDGLVLMDQLVRPSVPIPAEASRIHGITNEMVADAPSFDELWATLDSILEGTRMVIYNADYDTAILRNALTRIHRSTSVTGECAMKAFAEWEGAPGKWPGSYRWWKLEDAAGKFGIPPGGHRARADAETARRVVLAMAASAVEPGDAAPSGIDFSSKLLARREAAKGIATPSSVPLFDLPDASRFTR